MIFKKSLSLLFPLMSLSLHVLAYLRFFKERANINLPEEWTLDFMILPILISTTGGISLGFLPLWKKVLCKMTPFST